MATKVCPCPRCETFESSLLRRTSLRNMLTSPRKVRQVRNSVMHTSTMTVTTADLLTYMTTMTDLLQDGRYLLNDPVAQQATLDIRQIQTTPIDVRDAAFMAHECQAWRHALSVADARQRQDILNLVASDSALEVSLQAEIAEVKRTLEVQVQAHDTRLQDHDTQLEDHDTRLEGHDIRLEGHEQQLRDIQTVQGQDRLTELATMRRIIEQQRQGVIKAQKTTAVQHQHACCIAQLQGHQQQQSHDISQIQGHQQQQSHDISQIQGHQQQQSHDISQIQGHQQQQASTSQSNDIFFDISGAVALHFFNESSTHVTKKGPVQWCRHLSDSDKRHLETPCASALLQ
ncbi:hypothetical protein LSAT2_012881 [Lamellibrachia satsuma]|nr:hypothetical protein LSAT2_012881 [Lamellibrachia satsuma]